MTAEATDVAQSVLYLAGGYFSGLSGSAAGKAAERPMC